MLALVHERIFERLKFRAKGELFFESRQWLALFLARPRDNLLEHLPRPLPHCNATVLRSAIQQRHRRASRFGVVCACTEFFNANDVALVVQEVTSVVRHGCASGLGPAREH